MGQRLDATRLVLGGTAAALAVAVSLWVSPPAFATTFYAPTDDAFTTSDAPFSTHGGDDRLKVGRVEPGKQQRIYLRFSLPGGDRCDDYAALAFNWITPPNGNQFWFGPLDSGGWDQSTINWNNQPDSIAIAEYPYAWSGGGTITQAVGPAVQYAFDHGIQNRGFVLRSRAPNGVFDQVQAWSSESANSQGYPFLAIVYC